MYLAYFGFSGVFLGAVDPARLVLLVMLVIFLLLALGFGLLLMKFFKLWLQAKLSCANVHFVELIGMFLRKSDYRQIVLCRITAVQAGLDITTRQLESHFLAGGDVANVVKAMIVASREDIELTWEQATAIDLAERDVLAEVKEAMETETDQ